MEWLMEAPRDPSSASTKTRRWLESMRRQPLRSSRSAWLPTTMFRLPIFDSLRPVMQATRAVVSGVLNGRAGTHPTYLPMAAPRQRHLHHSRTAATVSCAACAILRFLLRPAAVVANALLSNAQSQTPLSVTVMWHQ